MPMKLSMKLGSLFQVSFMGIVGVRKGSYVVKFPILSDAGRELGFISVYPSRKSLFLSSVVSAVGDILGASGKTKVEKPVVEGVSVNVVNGDADRDVALNHQPDGPMHSDGPVDSIDLEVGSHATGFKGALLPPSGSPYFSATLPRNDSSFWIVIKGLAKSLSQGTVFGRLRIGSHDLSDFGFSASRSVNFRWHALFMAQTPVSKGVF
jgi:hypothetical protein